MRGKLQVNGVRAGDRRIIPAHAGQTGTYRPDLAVHSDHPRTCGANKPAGELGGLVRGSSPHMRGKRVPFPAGGLSHRIIPAHAGQTPPGGLTHDVHADHPRTCGANASVVVTFHVSSGSSPHMRGKHTHLRAGQQRGRIIPAHAGQTRAYPQRPSRHADHPRTCGANFLGLRVVCVRCGSSPHMRGKHAFEQAGKVGIRIIPAHAGQTSGTTTS